MIYGLRILRHIYTATNTDLALVAQKVISAIHRISLIHQIKMMQLSNKLYPLDRTYPVENAIHLSCNQALVLSVLFHCKIIQCRCLWSHKMFHNIFPLCKRGV